MKPFIFPSAAATENSAFTRMDLLALLVTVGMLGLMLVPVLARNRPQVPQCMNNLRQLGLAWHMYANESNDKIMSNPQESTVGYGAVNYTNLAWVYGYLSFTANVPDNTNSILLTSGLMGLYVHQTKLFKCPSDYWQCTEGNQLMNRVRSYSMNYCMEGDANDAIKVAEGYPLDKVFWDSGVPRFGYHKVTDFGGRLPGPAPAAAWVFCDEHPDTINNGCLAWGGPADWADTPASYHELGDDFGFADGHVEYHKWRSGYNATQDAGICKPVDLSGSFTAPAIGNTVDYLWVTTHATASYP